VTTIAAIRDGLASFETRRLFIEVLGWDRAPSQAFTVPTTTGPVTVGAVAQKRGMTVYVSQSANIPATGLRREVQHEVAKRSLEHIVIFQNDAKTAQVWQWVRREPGKGPRTLYERYAAGDTGERLAQKLAYLGFTLDDEVDLTIVDVAGRARQAFNVDRVTRAFYETFRTEHDAFLGRIEGIGDTGDREWYASLMLNRLMFVYFFQKRGFLAGDRDYLRNRLQSVRESRGPGEFLTFYRHFLSRLFHEGLGHPQPRGASLDALLGDVPYLNGGLFDVHTLEREYTAIDIPDEAFARIFAFFNKYEWHLDDRPLRRDDEINPDVLGYIFEKYINQRQMGAYYTREDITGYMAAATVLPGIVTSLIPSLPHVFGDSGLAWSLLQEQPDRYIPGVLLTPELLPDEIDREREERLRGTTRLRAMVERGEIRRIEQVITHNLDLRQLMVDVVGRLEDVEVAEALYAKLRSLTILDPACGSGAFLFAALNVLQPLYEACLALFEGARDDGRSLPESVAATLAERDAHPNRDYYVLKTIIVRNLFGVDIMEEAVEIAKLRLFLKLAGAIDRAEAIEPLPDVDFNIRAGNTLVGFATRDGLRDAIIGRDQVRFDLDDNLPVLDVAIAEADQAFDRFQRLQTETGGYDQVVAAKSDYRDRLAGLRHTLDRYLAAQRGARSDSEIEAWVQAHKPFHWFVEFFGINLAGGFQVILGNPPYVGFARTATSRDTGVGSPFASLFSDYRTVTSGNLYGLMIERSLELVAPGGHWAMIVPLSITFSGDQSSVRELVLENSGVVWYSSYDNIPDRAFTGTKESTNTSTANQQRVTIVIARRQLDGGEERYATPTLRWRSSERERLFADLPYATVDGLATSARWPKVGSVDRHVGLLQEVSGWPRLASIQARVSSHTLVVPRTAGYYIAAYADAKARSKQMTLHFRDADARALALVVLNSNFFFWWYRVFGDGFDVTGDLVESCPIPPRPDDGYKSLAAELLEAQPACTVYKAYRGEMVPNVNYNQRMDLLARCDDWIAGHLVDSVPLDWPAMLRYKSSSWFSFEVAKASSWPESDAALGIRNLR
jgi:hypothetical protein